MEHQWMRAAAAAAIVMVVVGGGWGVYTRVERVQSGHVVTTQSAPTAGGFSGAGAMRTPETIPGPTIAKPAKKSAKPMKERSVKSAARAGTLQETNPSSSRP